MTNNHQRNNKGSDLTLVHLDDKLTHIHKDSDYKFVLNCRSNSTLSCDNTFLKTACWLLGYRGAYYFAQAGMNMG